MTLQSFSIQRKDQLSFHKQLKLIRCSSKSSIFIIILCAIQYKDRELKPIERNLFKGIFLRRPAKPLIQVKESEQEESQSSFNSSFASDFTNNINNKYSQDKPSQRIKSVRERSYEVTEEYDDGNDFTQQEVNMPYFPTIQRDDMEMAASQKLHKVKQQKIKNDSEQVNNFSQSHSNNNEFDSFHRGSSKSSKKVTIRKKILSQGQVSWGNLAVAPSKAPIGLSKFRKHSQIIVTQPQPRQNIDYSQNEFSDRSVITSISSLNPSRHSKKQSSLVPISKPRHISQMNVLQEQFTGKKSVTRGAISSNSRPVVQRVQQQREHSSNMTDRAHPHLDDADTQYIFLNQFKNRRSSTAESPYQTPPIHASWRVDHNTFPFMGAFILSFGPSLKGISLRWRIYSTNSGQAVISSLYLLQVPIQKAYPTGIPAYYQRRISQFSWVSLFHFLIIYQIGSYQTERKLASSNIKRNESFRIQDSSIEEVESQIEAGEEEISFRKVDKGKKRMIIYH